MAGNRWRSDRWEHQSRLFRPMLPCPASVGGGGSGGAACYHRPQRHVPASGQSSQGCRRAIESIWQSPMGPMRKRTRGQPETKMRPPMRKSRQSLGALSALRPAAVPGIAIGAATSSAEALVQSCQEKTRPQGASGAIGECSPAPIAFSLTTETKPWREPDRVRAISLSPALAPVLQRRFAVGPNDQLSNYRIAASESRRNAKSHN